MADLHEDVAKLSVDPKNQAENGSKSSPGKKKEASSRPVFMSPPPEFIDKRIQMFDDLKAKYDAKIASKERKEIEITLF